MLLEVQNNQILVDKKPFIEDFRINVDPSRQLLRLKTKYVMLNQEQESVDLALAYTKPQISLPLVVIELTGQELLRNIEFNLTLSFHLLKMRFHIKGRFGGKKIDDQPTGIIDFLKLIKSVI